MIETLHIITPCSRPYNLMEVGKSIPLDIPCKWWIIFDMDGENLVLPERFIKETKVETKFKCLKGGVSGNLQRNYALDKINDGWVYFLDDDNIIHPNFEKAYKSLVLTDYKGMIFGQQLETQKRIPRPDYIKTCFVDQAQFILKRELIGDLRYIQRYEADGIFIETLYKKHSEEILITEEILSYYNKLKWTK